METNSISAKRDKAELDLTTECEPFDVLREWMKLVKLQDGKIIIAIKGKTYLVQDPQG